ncbi:MAG: hypothetical protein H6817_06130 [Phycisphaerales bacterium]|nr:hypothetical protein [Phycisphaerales bacterium]
MTTTKMAHRTEHDIHGDLVVRRPSASKRLRLRGLALLLIVSAMLFVAVVCWQRDLVHVKRATDTADLARTWIAQFYEAKDYLPFALPDKLARQFISPEIPYPSRDEIYTLTGIPGPYVLIATARQGLLPPREAGSAAVIFDHGEFRTEWMSSTRVTAEQRHRDALLGRTAVVRSPDAP